MTEPTVDVALTRADLDELRWAIGEVLESELVEIPNEARLASLDALLCVAWHRLPPVGEAPA